MRLAPCYALPSMQRVSPGVFVGMGVAVLGWLYVRSAAPPAYSARPIAVATGAPVASAGADLTNGQPPVLGDGGSAASGPDDGGGGAGVIDMALAPSPLGDRGSGVGAAMADGSPVPQLDAKSPKSLNFAVVLVQYAGAEGSKRGSRSREQAQTLAAELAKLANDDFDAAVAKGDPGSSTNAGRMFRGILEPAPEYALFSLAKGEVSEPVDTPRGYWIVKRLK